MAKKRKPEYEDLSDKERSRLELKGMKDNNNDVSISALDAGKAAYEAEGMKANNNDVSKSELKERKKTNRQQKKDLKKRGSVDSEAPVTQTKTPREKKVESAVKQVEKMTEAFGSVDSDTWANPDGTITEGRTTMGPGTGSTTATPSYSTAPRFQSPDIVKATSAEGLKNLQKQRDNNVIDNVRSARANPNYYEAEEAAIGQVDDQVKEESDKVKAAQSLNDLVNNPDNVSDEELEAGKTLTTEDVAEMEKEVQDAIISGSPDAEAMKREFNNYLNESKFNAAEPAIEKLGVQQYYPDLGTPLQVGSYSGSRIGTVSIFGHGSDRIPVGIMDARRRALDKAAAKRAKNKNKIIEMAYAKGAIPLQGRIDDKSWEIINKYSELSGNNIGKLDYNTKLGRQFWKEVREHNTFAARTKMTEGIVNQLSKDVLDDTKYVPQFVQDEMLKFNRGLLGEDLNMKTINSSEKRLRAWTEATGVLNELDKKRLQLDEAPVNPNLDWSNPEVVKSANDAILKIRGGNYDNIFTLTKQFMDPSRIEALIDPIIEQNNLYLGEGTKKSAEQYREQYFNYVLGLHPEIVTDKLTNIVTNSANKAKARALQRDIYIKDTVLDGVFKKDRLPENQKSKQGLGQAAFNYSEGVGDVNSVKTAYVNHMGYEPVVDPNNPNLVRGVIPLTNKQKNSEVNRNVNALSYRLEDGNIYTYEQAVNTAKASKSSYIESNRGTKKELTPFQKVTMSTGEEDAAFITDEELAREWEQENPKYNTLLILDGNTSADLRIESNTHSYYMTDENGSRKELDATNLGENIDVANNLLTTNYGGSITVNVPIIDENTGEPQMVALKPDGSIFESWEEIPDSHGLFVPMTTKKTYPMLQAVDRSSIDNLEERNIADESYKGARIERNVSQGGAAFTGVSAEDGVYDVPSGGIRQHGGEGSNFTIKQK